MMMVNALFLTVLVVAINCYLALKRNNNGKYN